MSTEQRELGHLIAQALVPLLAAGVRAELQRAATSALPDLLSKKEAARMARCTPKTIDSYIARGLLTAIRRTHSGHGRVFVSRVQLEKMLGGQL